MKNVETNSISVQVSKGCESAKFLVMAAASALLFASCAPTAKQIKDIVEKDPSIVFVAIEKDPDKFIEIVNEAAQKAQKRAQEKAMDEEKRQRDEEFKNPLKPVVEDDRVVFGNKGAKVTIIEYSDFECPFCTKGYNVVKEILSNYKDDVRIIFKHLPLPMHPEARPAAEYFEAIAKQDHDKAHKFHDAIFENQSELRQKKEGFLKEMAKKVGADMGRLAKDLKDESIKKRIDTDSEEANKFNFSGTPGFIINGVSLRGAYPFNEFKDIIDKHLGKK